MSVFMIIGKNDSLLFESEFFSSYSKNDSQEDSYSTTFMIHSSLDILEESVWKNPNM